MPQALTAVVDHPWGARADQGLRLRRDLTVTSPNRYLGTYLIATDFRRVAGNCQWPMAGGRRVGNEHWCPHPEPYIDTAGCKG